MEQNNTSTQPVRYDYAVAGFDDFLGRSIDAGGLGALNGGGGGATSRQIKLDQQQTSGSLGDQMTIGTITLDGAKGRITIADDTGNIVVILGELGD